MSGRTSRSHSRGMFTSCHCLHGFLLGPNSQYSLGNPQTATTSRVSQLSPTRLQIASTVYAIDRVHDDFPRKTREANMVVLSVPSLVEFKGMWATFLCCGS
jgi:hypothetical protein